MAAKKTVTPDPVVILSDTYQVTLDKRCLILKKKALAEDGELSKEEQKEGLRILGYYSTWEHLGTSLVKEITREKAKVNKEEKVSLTEFINIVKETNKEVSEMFKDIDKSSKISKSK